MGHWLDELRPFNSWDEAHEAANARWSAVDRYNTSKGENIGKAAEERTMNRLLRLPDVLSLTGLSRSRLYADPSFPKSVKIGERAVAWVEDEVRDWIDARIAERV